MFWMKKWSRNQCSFVNVHNYKSQKKLFFTSHERKIFKCFFSELAFWKFKLCNTIPQCKMRFWDNFYFNTSHSPLCVMPWKSQNPAFHLYVSLLRSHHKYYSKKCFFTMLLLGRYRSAFWNIFLISVALSLCVVLRLSNIIPGGSRWGW